MAARRRWDGGSSCTPPLYRLPFWARRACAAVAAVAAAAVAAAVAPRPVGWDERRGRRAEGGGANRIYTDAPRAHRRPPHAAPATPPTRRNVHRAGGVRDSAAARFAAGAACLAVDGARRSPWPPLACRHHSTSLPLRRPSTLPIPPRRYGRRPATVFMAAAPSLLPSPGGLRRVLGAWRHRGRRVVPPPVVRVKPTQTGVGVAVLALWRLTGRVSPSTLLAVAAVLSLPSLVPSGPSSMPRSRGGGPCSWRCRRARAVSAFTSVVTAAPPTTSPLLEYYPRRCGRILDVVPLGSVFAYPSSSTRAAGVAPADRLAVVAAIPASPLPPRRQAAVPLVAAVTPLPPPPSVPLFPGAAGVPAVRLLAAPLSSRTTRRGRPLPSRVFPAHGWYSRLPLTSLPPPGGDAASPLSVYTRHQPVSAVGHPFAVAAPPAVAAAA